MLHTILAGSQTTRVLPTFISSSANSITTGSSITVTAPTGIQNGDLLVAVGSTSTTGVIVTPPSGFNALGTRDSTYGMYVATKVANSESGNYTFTYSTGGATTAAILVYRNATAVNCVGDVSYSTTATGTASAITPSYRGILLAAFANPSSTRTMSSPPSGMTERVARATSAKLYVYELSPQEAVSTGTKAASWDTASANVCSLLQVTNEPDVTPTLIATAQTQNAATGATLVINKPTGTADGDLMVAVMAAGGTVTWTGDTSWTEPADQGSSPSLRIAYKTAGASEPSSYTFTASTALQRLSGCILTYRYAAYDTIAGAFTTGADPLILTSISPTASQSKLIAAGARAINSVTLGTPTSMTAQVTDADGTTPSYIVCDQKVSSGSVGTRSMSTGSTTGVAGIMLAIKPTRSL